MDDNKFNDELFSYFEEDDLTFTKEDRVETFKKIQRNNKKNINNNTTFFDIGKRHLKPIFATVMALLIAIVIFSPNLFSDNGISIDNPNSQQASQPEGLSFSVLVMGKDPSTHRSNINILLTYNSSVSSVKLVPIPRDTYVETFNSKGKKIGEDKLMHAAALNPQPEIVLTTVSNLFDISVDYYSVIEEEDLYGELGIKKDDGKDNRTLVSEVGDTLEEQLSFSKVKELLEESETNIPSDIFNEIKGVNSDSIHVMDMEKGIEEKSINGIYYVDINQKLLDEVSDTLKQHLSVK